jgi:hypothetical protein
MDDLRTFAARLQHDADLPAVLAASFDAFEVIRRLARRCQNLDPDLFAAFMSTAATAADGRDAITTAPSLSPGPATQLGGMPQPADDPAEAADAITALAIILATWLDGAADQSAIPGDRTACKDAGDAARQIRQLMTSGDLP